MPCRPEEESAQGSEEPNPVTPTKRPRNAGAAHDNPDAENSECLYDSDQPVRTKKFSRVDKQKRERHLIVYEPIKRWLTGEKAEMDDSEMWFQVADEARKEMLIAGLKKAMHPKDTDLGFWKKAQEHESRGIHYTIYRCPMNYRCHCKCLLRLVMAPNKYVELQRSENRHDANSHAQDDSKTLKYKQLVVIRDAVLVAPQLSASTLRRNLMSSDSPEKNIAPEHLRCLQRQVYMARKSLCAKQLRGFELDESFGKLEEFAVSNMWSDLVNKHNDPDDAYHIGLFEFCLIGHQNMAAHDVLRHGSHPGYLDRVARTRKKGF
jgi:hypothetical protein